MPIRLPPRTDGGRKREERHKESDSDGALEARIAGWTNANANAGAKFEWKQSNQFIEFGCELGCEGEGPIDAAVVLGGEASPPLSAAAELPPLGIATAAVELGFAFGNAFGGGYTPAAPPTPLATICVAEFPNAAEAGAGVAVAEEAAVTLALTLAGSSLAWPAVALGAVAVGTKYDAAAWDIDCAWACA